MKLQFDINKRNLLKDILIQLEHIEPTDLIQQELDTHFSHVDNVDFRLTVHELLSNEDAITMESVQKLFTMDLSISEEQIEEKVDLNINHQGHPMQLFKREMKTFHSIIEQIDHQLGLLKNGQGIQEDGVTKELKYFVFRLGEFHKHFHRKEKLFFPIMERYGYYNPIRITWRADDVIRALYQGIKRQFNRLPHIDLNHVHVTYDRFRKEFKEMLFQEEAIILPVLKSLFNEDDWLAIAKESVGFGYARTCSEEEWEISSYSMAFITKTEEAMLEESRTESITTSKSIAFGGGYLTLDEANLILNHLPLEITFIDKNGVFKYFNKITKASDMMFVRTPISIGRNVANCHPPKSLKKVMRLIRDLKTKKRTSECMWFKKGDQYVHITYKAIFNEKGEYQGILEYVQDIQPFFHLPSDVKRVLSMK